MSNFSQPGQGGDKFTAAEHNGALLLFFPTQLDQNIPTVNGNADAITTRIVNLNTGQVLDDAKVWGKALIPQLKGAIPDGMVLGRLGQGQSKGGNNAPWLLHPHTEQDVQVAEQWLAQNPQNSFNQPQTQAPQNQGWGQQAPTPPASAAPATGGWQQQGGPAPAAPQPGGWGNPPVQGGWQAPAAASPQPAAPAPAPTATSNVDPALVQALTDLGVTLPPGATQATAESIWAMYAPKR